MVAAVAIAVLLATVRWNNHRPHHAGLGIIVGILIANTVFGRFIRSAIQTAVHGLQHLH